METSVSLLDRLRGREDESAWRRLDELYRPLLQRWLLRIDPTLGHDVDDLCQEVLTVVFHELPHFDRQRTGSFRRWLRLIAVHRIKNFWRARQARAAAVDGAHDGLLRQLEDPASELSRQWEHEHNQHVVQWLLKLIANDFQPKTMEAFRLVVFDGLSAAAAAARLGLTDNAVLLAKARVLARLRQEGQGLLD